MGPGRPDDRGRGWRHIARRAILFGNADGARPLSGNSTRLQAEAGRPPRFRTSVAGSSSFPQGRRLRRRLYKAEDRGDVRALPHQDEVSQRQLAFARQ
jgi:hypothetical protein